MTMNGWHYGMPLPVQRHGIRPGLIVFDLGESLCIGCWLNLTCGLPSASAKDVLIMAQCAQDVPL